jgi:putative peptidoglycan lipid II flippase
VPAITPAVPQHRLHRRRARPSQSHFDPPVVVLAWAVFAGGVLQLAFQIPFLLKLGSCRGGGSISPHPGVRAVLTLMLPAAFGVSVSQISLADQHHLRSFLVSGSVLLAVLRGPPDGVSRGGSRRRARHYPAAEPVQVTMQTPIMRNIPPARLGPARDRAARRPGRGGAGGDGCAAGRRALPLGRFTTADVFLTREALAAYSIGLVWHDAGEDPRTGFYARQNIATPVRVGIFTLAVTQLMNLAFIGPFKHAGSRSPIGLARA